MISVLIWTGKREQDVRLRDVSRTLTALVPFAVEGLVRDVHLIASAPDSGLINLADEAGANLFEPTDTKRAIETLKSEVGLVLAAGFDLQNRLADQLERHAKTRSGEMPARIEMQGLGWFRDRFSPEIAGFLASRAALLTLPQLDPANVKRHFRKMRVLKARLVSRED